jgi:hypothetical protein
MGASDLLILTIYFICVVYVLYQMALSVEAGLEDQVAIALDEDTVQEAVTTQLAQQNRSDVAVKIVPGKMLALQLSFPSGPERENKVQIQVGPQGSKPLQPPIQNLSVTVLNSLPQQQIFLDWDSSSLSVHGGLAYRVIRNVPGMPLDLLQRQVYTVANPNQAVNIAVTSEALFRRPENSTALQSAPVLINLEQASMMQDFMRVYALRMQIWIKSTTHPERQPIRLLIPFNFQIEVLPDHVALPVLSWLLDLFAPKAASR